MEFVSTMSVDEITEILRSETIDYTVENKLNSNKFLSKQDNNEFWLFYTGMMRNSGLCFHGYIEKNEENVKIIGNYEFNTQTRIIVLIVTIVLWGVHLISLIQNIRMLVFTIPVIVISICLKKISNYHNYVYQGEEVDFIMEKLLTK